MDAGALGEGCVFSAFPPGLARAAIIPLFSWVRKGRDGLGSEVNAFFYKETKKLHET